MMMVAATAVAQSAEATPQPVETETVQPEMVSNDMPNATKAKKGCCANKAKAQNGKGCAGKGHGEGQAMKAQKGCGGDKASKGKGCCAGKGMRAQNNSEEEGAE